ncbi:O-antigen polysaccharide polymerase Wzy [Oscillospiraceae bacterium NTUH-002-81]|nr:O-antigen polysaccharide polymerase Wzy [Oscillospiraceae bacterium NTUH-002-81]
MTFSWLCAGLAKAEQLRNRGVVSYTFGPLIDWLRHGTIARLLGADALTESNSIQNATESNILAHHLSWILLGKKKYLQGHGTGSCYILELFLDFRFWGVFLVGILLGMCLFAFFPFGWEKCRDLFISVYDDQWLFIHAQGVCVESN